MNLTRRLLLLALISILPAIVIWTYTEVSLRRAREAEVRDLALRQAQLAASELDRIFEGIRNVLVAVSETPEVREPGHPGCEAYLSALDKRLDPLKLIVLLDSEGRIRCGRNTRTGELRFDDRPYFKDAIATGRFTVGQYTHARLLQQPVLPVALPVHDPSGRVSGMLAAAVDLKWLGREIGERVLPDRGSLTVADRDGIILAREPLPEQFVGNPIPAGFRNLVDAAHPGTFEALSQDGTKRIFGYVPAALSRHRIYVSAGLSSKVAFSTINAAAKRGFMLIAAAFVLALSLAGLSGRVFVTRPFERMIAAVRAWRHGDYSARISLPPGSGELGILAGAFNDLMDDIAQRQAELRESEERARLALDAGGMGTWWFDPVAKVTHWSPQAAALIGLAPDRATSRLRDLRMLMHPEDLPRARTSFDAALRNGDYEAEFRIRQPGGGHRWINAKGRVFFDPKGQPINMVGVLQDTTGRRQAEEQRSLLLDELNHRVKNTLATVQSIASQTLRTAEPAHFKAAFESRILALSKTHDLLTRNAWREADLRAVIEQEVAPYRREVDDRITVSGPKVSLPARAVINLGLIAHELVTNAAKYGALSVPHGRIEITWSVLRNPTSGPELHLTWVESGGPPVVPPKRQGFGSRLIQRSVEGELNGHASLEYLPSGVVGTFVFPVNDSTSSAAGAVPRRSAAAASA